MSEVNFRGWRNEKRKKRTKSYIELNIFISALILFILVMTNVVTTALINKQSSINDYLKKEDSRLNEQLDEIGGYENKVKEITERMNIINVLQEDRISSVVVFDEIAKKTPKEIKLTKLKRESGYILIEGISVSQLTISNYLKNLNNSEHLSSPRLEQVIADKKVDGFERSRFYIKAIETINME